MIVEFTWISMDLMLFENRLNVLCIFVVTIKSYSRLIHAEDSLAFETNFISQQFYRNF